jgi:N-methylhydantoinase A/oxoprolinase/acetone carboxylase beta subunit
VWVGVDSGGTFTDAVAADGNVRKVLSTPDAPDRAVAAAIGGWSVTELSHGTTVATNALLEGRLARVALYANAGLEDVIEIGRQRRPAVFDHFADRPPALVARSHRIGVVGRLDATGREIEPVGAVPDPPEGTEAVAVCLLHSDLNPAHEAAVAAALGGWDVSLSVEVSPEHREFERAVTTVLNAGLRPVCRDYLARLADLAPRVFVMTSAGGLVPVAYAAERPVSLLLSGPAGGVAAAAQVAAAHGFDDAVSFDMGGTSTDVCLIRGGRPEPAAERSVAGYPVRVPALDIHTVGAGGGSIAWIDAGGALRVGPRSAGAAPGPACYGRGGTQPTVTDANLVAGHIPTSARFGNLGALDPDAAAAALGRLGVTAADVLAVADAEMAHALRVVTVARGVDPRGLPLVAFGGAGPMHACSLAGELGMDTVIVPARAGAFSAVGIIGAPVSWELVQSWAGGVEGLEAARAELGVRARSFVEGMVGGDVEVTGELDVRYRGQGHELRVGDLAEFPHVHRERNGFTLDDVEVEVVALRARATVTRPVSLPAAPERPSVRGPAVIDDPDCTIWVPPGWRAEPGVEGATVIRRG